MQQLPHNAPSVSLCLRAAFPDVIAGAVIWSDGGNGGITNMDYTGQWMAIGYGWLRATWVYADGPDTANAVDFANPPFGCSGDVADVTIAVTGGRTPIGLKVQWISSVTSDAPPTYGGSVNVQFIGSNG